MFFAAILPNPICSSDRKTRIHNNKKAPLTKEKDGQARKGKREGKKKIKWPSKLIIATGLGIPGVVFIGYLSLKTSVYYTPKSLRKKQEIENYNPYSLPGEEKYKVVNIDFENSTLDETSAVADFVKDSKNLVLTSVIGEKVDSKGKKETIEVADFKNVKHIWPAYVTFRLLGDKVYKDPKHQKIFYKDPKNEEISTKLQEILSQQSDKAYFHSCSSIENFKKIAKSGQIKVTREKAYAGAFFSAGKIASRGDYGSFTFVLDRSVEFYTLPLVYQWEHVTAEVTEYWAGFWDDISLGKHLTTIYFDRNLYVREVVLQRLKKSHPDREML